MANHVLLDSRTHAELRVRTDRGAELGDGVMSCLAVPAEFRSLQNEYPILFRLNLERDSYGAVALLGFETGENLYLQDGRWDARYLPLALDIQPFLIGMAEAGAETKQVHVDLDSARVTAGEGLRVFDEHGRATPYLEEIAEKLGALDEGYQASDNFHATLRRYELLEPMTFEVTLEDGSTNRLVGFHVIDEDRLRGLDPGVIGELHSAGYLLPIFMAVASLANLGALVARKNRRLRNG
jgi:hypothetical protein